MLLHRRHLDGGQNIIDEHDVVIPKRATIHQATLLGMQAIRSSVGTLRTATGFQNNLCRTGFASPTVQ